jgi:hypothetical protein
MATTSQFVRALATMLEIWRDADADDPIGALTSGVEIADHKHIPFESDKTKQVLVSLKDGSAFHLTIVRVKP